jgi:hypothetical protein
MLSEVLIVKSIHSSPNANNTFSAGTLVLLRAMQTTLSIMGLLIIQSRKKLVRFPFQAMEATGLRG